MEVLTLQHPLLINGQEIAEVTHDIDEITIEQFAEAEARKFKSGSASIKGATLELDYSMQVYLGMAAILAVNPSYDFNDLERIKGKDLRALFEIGRNFMKGGVEDSSQEEISDELSETTLESTTPPPVA